jgi:hypothetical protein
MAGAGTPSIGGKIEDVRCGESVVRGDPSEPMLCDIRFARTGVERWTVSRTGHRAFFLTPHTTTCFRYRELR